MARSASNPWWATAAARHPAHCERAVYVDGLGLCPERELSFGDRRNGRPDEGFWPRLFGHRTAPEAAGDRAPAKAGRERDGWL